MRDNVHFFWHPIMKKKICRGVGKFLKADLEQLIRDMTLLLDEKPKTFSEAPLGIHREAFDFYFSPIYGAEWSLKFKEYEALSREAAGGEWQQAEERLARPDTAKDYAALEAENVRLRAQVDALASVIADMRKPPLSTGTPTLDANLKQEAKLSGAGVVAKKRRTKAK